MNNQLIEKLEQLRLKSCKPLYIPSLGRSVSFTPLNALQQKKLIESAIESPVYQILFSNQLNQILKSNCLDKGVDVDTLTYLDRECLVLQLRQISFGSDYTQTKDDVSVKFNIDVIIDQYKKLNTNTIVDEKFTSEDGITITVGIPLLKIDSTINKANLERANKLNVNDATEFRAIAGDALIREKAKFIRSIVIGEEVVNFSNLSDVDMASIVETLPVGSISEFITDFINKYNKVATSARTITTVTEEGKEVSVLDISVGLFAK